MSHPSIMAAYSRPLELGVLPQPPEVSILSSKFTPGEKHVDGIVPLDELLLTEWPVDLHFLQYTHPSESRLLKMDVGHHEGIRFEVAVFDLDFRDHQERPTLDDFENLLRVAFVFDFTPNIVYSTRGGARWVFLIEPIFDERLFEAHYRGLMKKLSEPIKRSSCGYKVDESTKDWTRLFRAPLVTRDGVKEFGHHVRVMHLDQLNLLEFKPVRQLVFRGGGRRAFPPAMAGELFESAKKFITECEPSIAGARGHDRAFAAACKLFRDYGQDAHAVRMLLDLFNDRCEPPWSARELDHKVHSAAKKCGVSL